MAKLIGTSKRMKVTEAEQLQRIRNAIYAMVNSLGAALPRTPEVRAALDALVESDIEST